MDDIAQTTGRQLICDTDNTLETCGKPSRPRAPGELSRPTVHDVAQFLAESPTLMVEPNAFGVAGAETNFVAGNAVETVVVGTLLGQPAQVRFVPIRFRWDYGDGTSQTTSTPGTSWQASGVNIFTKTATSHLYAVRGTYLATVTVRFSAQYQFAGQGWEEVDGTLELESAPVEVTIKAMKVELVPGPCTKYPNGPGCNP